MSLPLVVGLWWGMARSVSGTRSAGGSEATGRSDTVVVDGGRRLDTLEHEGPRQVLVPADSVWQTPLALVLAGGPLPSLDAPWTRALPMDLQPWLAAERVARLPLAERLAAVAAAGPDPVIGPMAGIACDAAVAQDPTGTVFPPAQVAHACALGLRRGTWGRWRAAHGPSGQRAVVAAADSLLRPGAVTWGESERQLLLTAAPVMAAERVAQLRTLALSVGDTLLGTVGLMETPAPAQGTPAWRLWVAAHEQRLGAKGWRAHAAAAASQSGPQLRALDLLGRQKGRVAAKRRQLAEAVLLTRLKQGRLAPVEEALLLEFALRDSSRTADLVAWARMQPLQRLQSWGDTRVGRDAWFATGAALWEAGQWRGAATQWQRLAEATMQERAWWWAGVALARSGATGAAHAWLARAPWRAGGYYATLARQLPTPAVQALRDDVGLRRHLAATQSRASWWRALGQETRLGDEWSWWRRRASRDADSLAQIAAAHLADGQWWSGGSVAWRALEAEWRTSPVAPRDTVLRLVYPLPRPDLLEAGLAAVRRTAPSATPEVLAALVQQESRWSPTVRSPVGATGWTQVMPETGRQLARQIGRPPDSVLTDLHTPAWNIRYGGTYLGSQIAARGLTAAAYAAYNAGPRRAVRWQRALAATAVPQDSLWFVERIPFEETRTYVRRITMGRHWYRTLWFSPATTRPVAHGP